MSFTGFPEQAFAFYEAVGADTSWETVEPRAELYERAIRAPMAALVAELEPEFGWAKLYNLHRSPDLWTHQYAYVSVADTHVFGVVLSLDGLSLEGGWLRSSPDQVERFRAAVLDPAAGRGLAEIVGGLTGHGYELLGIRLARMPRGVGADHPRAELLRYRSLLATRDLGRGGWIHEPVAVERVRDGWRTLRPLVEWLGEHVGPRDTKRPR